MQKIKRQSMIWVKKHLGIRYNIMQLNQNFSYNMYAEEKKNPDDVDSLS